jgi:hypothetical protein
MFSLFWLNGWSVSQLPPPRYVLWFMPHHNTLGRQCPWIHLGSTCCPWISGPRRRSDELIHRNQGQPQPLLLPLLSPNLPPDHIVLSSWFWHKELFCVISSVSNGRVTRLRQGQRFLLCFHHCPHLSNEPLFPGWRLQRRKIDTSFTSFLCTFYYTLGTERRRLFYSTLHNLWSGPCPL